MLEAIATRTPHSAPKVIRDADRVSQMLQGRKGDDTFTRVDDILNLGSGIGDLSDLSRDSLAETFSVLAELYDRGIVGYEVREVNGEPMKVFTDVAIGSDLHRAPLYKDGRLDTYS